MAKKPIVPKNFDPNVAHIIDAEGNIFQELAPVEKIEVVVEHDDDGNAVTETVVLPREWDEAATVAKLEG